MGFSSLRLGAFLLIFHLALPSAARAEPVLIDRIVAVIDNQVILWSELNFRLEMALRQEGRRYISDEDRAEYTENLLNAMIDRQVLVLKAQKDSLEVDLSQIETLVGEQMQNIRTSLGETQLEEMLERTGFTERQLRSRYRKDIRQQLLAEQVQTQLAYRLHVTHKDVDAYRQQHLDKLPPRISLSQINLKVKPGAEKLEEIRLKIEEIEAKLSAGEDFANVAATHSEDPATAATGGDLGCFAHGNLVPEFEQAAMELKPGQVSAPVLTQFGFHLIKLREKRETELCTSHILVRASVTDEDKQRTQKQLEDLYQRALAGEDFAELARAHSDDQATARRGGLWQILSPEQIPPFLAPHLKGLQLGGVSKPFFLDDGGHIIKINDDQATLEGFVREERLGDTLQQIIDEFKKEIYIDVRLDPEDLSQNL